MNKIGIRAHDIVKANIEELALKVADEGFTNIQLVLKKAIINENGILTEEKGYLYKKVFDQYNISVAMLGAYFNPVHSNPNVVNQGISQFKNHLFYAHILGTKYVGTETGSYNDDKWTYNPQNITEEAYQKVKSVFTELTEYAKTTDAYVTIEGAYGHVINTPKRLKRLVDELNSDKVKVIIDIYNYLSIENYRDYQQIFKEAITLLKDKIVLFHLKDFIINDNKLQQVGIGQGYLDYKFIINTIMTECPNAYLIFEGVINEDIKSSFDLVNQLINNYLDSEDKK